MMIAEAMERLDLPAQRHDLLEKGVDVLAAHRRRQLRRLPHRDRAERNRRVDFGAGDSHRQRRRDHADRVLRLEGLERRQDPWILDLPESRDAMRRLGRLRAVVEIHAHQRMGAAVLAMVRTFQSLEMRRQRIEPAPATLQVPQHVGRALVTSRLAVAQSHLRVPPESALDDVAQHRRHRRIDHVRQGRHLVETFVEKAERKRPRRHLVQDDAERIDVAAGGDPAHRILGSQIRQRAAHGDRLRQPLHHLADAEVGHPGDAARVDEDVLGLDVAMNDVQTWAFLEIVQGTQPVGDLDREVEELLERQSLAVQVDGIPPCSRPSGRCRSCRAACADRCRRIRAPRSSAPPFGRSIR